MEIPQAKVEIESLKPGDRISFLWPMAPWKEGVGTVLEPAEPSSFGGRHIKTLVEEKGETETSYVHESDLLYLL